MNDRLSRLVAAWLSHPTGILQAFVTTVVWFSVPVFVGFSLTSALFWYLAYCTFISFATQFTLSYQNAKADRALGLTLRNQADTMRLVLTLAERDVETGDRLQEAVSALDADVERMLEIANTSREIHRKNARLIEQLAQRNRTILEAALDAANRAIEPD